MTWSTTEIKYEGFPLLLRRPDHDDIWQYKDRLTQLTTVEHLLDKATSKGLPENSYNKSLTDFDHYMCTIFDKSVDGVIFLIETFAGKRNYYYYTLPQYDISKQIDKAKLHFNVKLSIATRDDNNWGFFASYPVELYKR